MAGNLTPPISSHARVPVRRPMSRHASEAVGYTLTPRPIEGAPRTGVAWLVSVNMEHDETRRRHNAHSAAVWWTPCADGHIASLVGSHNTLT